jgi:hypothetical protein
MSPATSNETENKTILGERMDETSRRHRLRSRAKTIFELKNVPLTEQGVVIYGRSDF